MENPKNAVFLFARLIYRDVKRYVAEHQAEYEDWLSKSMSVAERNTSDEHGSGPKHL